VKFPHTVGFRKLTATIYGRSEAYPFYRMAVRVAGKRIARSFQTFAEAKLRQTAAGNVAAELSAKESAGAIAIRRTLAAFDRDTGRKLSALEAATTCLDALRLLPTDVPLVEAVRTYCRTLAKIKAKSLAAAVAEFNTLRSKMTLAKEGKRPQLNPKYQANVETWLNDFAAKLPGHNLGGSGTKTSCRIHSEFFRAWTKEPERPARDCHDVSPLVPAAGLFARRWPAASSGRA